MDPALLLSSHPSMQRAAHDVASEPLEPSPGAIRMQPDDFHISPGSAPSATAGKVKAVRRAYDPSREQPLVRPFPAPEGGGRS